MKVAIVHEWLDSFAGSERVVEQLLAEWPEADLHVLVDFMPEAERGWLNGARCAPASCSACPSRGSTSANISG